MPSFLKARNVQHLLRRAKARLGGSVLTRSAAPAISQQDMDTLKMLAAHAPTQTVRGLPPNAPFEQAELKVFSQFGDDGIIQFLLSHVQVPNRRFVEFGVEDYLESNTRYLLLKSNWSGLVMDGSDTHVKAIRGHDFFWRHDLQAESAFITKENINALLTTHGFVGDLGLLSIDIDGNDYWVWDAIHVVRPTLVIVEYNSVFGLAPVSVPYDPGFQRTRAHFSNLYWGCSLGALEHLARAKGYDLLGCNSAGNNAYFVRADQCGALPAKAAVDAYVESKFCDSRSPDGTLTHLRGEARRRAIGHLPVTRVDTGATMSLSDALQSARR